MKFTLFVDESGDAGISKLRSGSKGGSSLYMTMGGVLVRNDDIPEILKKLNDFRESITKQDSLHCCKLCHERKVNFGRFLAIQPLLCFGVISHKKTLGSYKETIGDKHTLLQ